MEKILDTAQVIDDNYEIKFFIEGSAFYQKYRAVGKDDKSYLLKIYNSSKLPRESFAKKGLLETEILSRLNINNIIKVVDNGELTKDNNKYHYIVFDFISGESLLEKLQREGVFSQYTAVPIVLNLLEALQELHSHPKSIIHNNINLESVTLDYAANTETPILTNFNCARYISSKSNSVDLTQLSPFFIAPELYNGIFTPQSDIFSMGALLYNLIMGIPPWYIEIPKYKHSQEKYVDAINENRNKKLKFGVAGIDEFTDEHLKNVIKKALSLNVDDRFKSTEDFIKALNSEMVLDGENEVKTSVRKTVKKNGEGFAAIAGMKELKDILHNDVIRALNEHELYESYGVTIPNGMLLYGPPGCGKTFISERFAEELGFNFIQLNPSDIKSKYLNATEEKIGEIFKEAIENAPTIIFIDEIDAIVPSRDSDLHHMHASTVNEILAQMSNCSEKGIFVIAATNRPDKIDPALLRTGRIDRIVYLPPPDYEARLAMFKLHLHNRPVDIAINYETLASKTENYVSSDIKYLVDEASRTALRTKERISQEILMNVITNIQPSVSFSEIQKYQAIKDKFENKKLTKENTTNPIGFIHNND